MGPQGLDGPAGPQGPPGLDGRPGISAAFAFVGERTDLLPDGGDLTIGELIGLPEGRFVVSAKARLNIPADLEDPRTVECTLEVGVAEGTDSSAVTIAASPGSATLPLLAVADLTAGGGATLTCSADGPLVSASQVKLTAVQVDSLLIQR